MDCKSNLKGESNSCFDELMRKYEKYMSKNGLLINNNIKIEVHEVDKDITMYYCCSNKSSLLVVPDFVTSIRVTQTIPKIDMLRVVTEGDSLTSIDSCFKGLNVNVLDIRKMNVTNVVSSRWAFCDASIDDTIMPTYKATSLVNAQGMFGGLNMTGKLDVSWICSDELFYGTAMFKMCLCNAIDMRNISGKKLEMLDDAFKNCINLVSINMEKLKFDNVVDMDNVIDGCDKLRVIINNDFKTLEARANKFDRKTGRGEVSIGNSELVRMASMIK